MSTSRAERHHEPDYAATIDSLTARFEGAFTRDEVASTVDEIRRELEPTSRVHDFLELLVERRALETLRARAREAAGESG